MMAQCHSAAMFHDYRLRGGSAGSFSLTATRKNYAFAVAQMSFESDDVNASRLVRKNLYRARGQFADSERRHPPRRLRSSRTSATTMRSTRGPHLRSGGVRLRRTATVDTIPAYCVIREWHQRERTERGAARPVGDRLREPALPPAPDRPQDFDVFAGGASLHICPRRSPPPAT